MVMNEKEREFLRDALKGNVDRAEGILRLAETTAMTFDMLFEYLEDVDKRLSALEEETSE